MPRLPVKQLGGLILSVDAKKLDKYLVLDGQNFLLDAEGPRSAFGFTRTYRSISQNEFVTSVTLGNTTFYFAHNQDSSECHVFTFNWAEKQFIHQFNVPEISASNDRKKFPWSVARVGGKHYVSHVSFGIHQYDALTNTWADVTTNIHTDLGGSVDIYAITQSAGRLIALITGWTAWSAIDDGTDFVPSTITGAGAQSLALIGTPETDAEYKGLFKVADGFLTVTDFGIMKSTIIDSINPFRHDVLSDEHIPINQNCVIQIATNTWIFLTRTGLYTTTGRDFQPWQPLMSEYLKLKEIPTFSQNEIGQVQLYYDEERQWFFISFSRTRNVNFFSTAFVLYLPRDEWGSFNYTHRSFVNVDEFGDNTKHSLAFITVEGKLCMFTDTTDNILLESQGDSLNSNTLQNEVYYTETELQGVTVNVDGVTVVSSTAFADANEIVHIHNNSWSLDQDKIASWYELYGMVETVATPDNPALPNDNTLDDFGEIVIDNEFNDGSNYTLTGGAVISGGKLRIDNVLPIAGEAKAFTTAITIEPRTWYELTIDIEIFEALTASNAFLLITFGGATALATPVFFGSPLSGTFTYQFRSSFSWTVQLQISTNGFPTHAIFRSVKAKLLDTVVSSTATYGKAEIVSFGFSKQLAMQTSLAAQIDFGLFRISDEQTSRQLTQITEVTFNMEDAVGAQSQVEDYMLDYEGTVIEDWMEIDDIIIDWGFAIQPNSSYTQSIMGTLDGVLQYEEQNYTLEEVSVSGKAKFTSCDILGLYHRINVAALTQGQSFHLKDVEMTGYLAGTL